MAAVVTETKVVQISGAPTSRIRIIGTTVLTAGTDNFRIQPGLGDVVISQPYNSRGLRRLDRWSMTCRTAQNATVPRITKSYNATNDANLLQITCVADQTYDWWVEGDDAGA